MSVRLKRILVSISLVTLGLIIWMIFWISQLNTLVAQRLEKGWFAPPIEYFSIGKVFLKNQKLGADAFKQVLLDRGYIERNSSQRLLPGDFQAEPCGENQNCVSVFRKSGPFQITEQKMTLSFDNQNTLTTITPEAEKFELEPELFAQFFGDQLILRDILALGRVPLSCLQAVTAIEDSDFLEHKGVSFSGTARAVLRNVLHGRFAEGGSTITQQLVKNAFLTHKKTLSRKLSEQVMAILLETKADKDQILQSYLNEIYMGQNGAFELRGFGAASRHYFNKNIDELELSECSMLAALINSPGRFNPFIHPDQALQRRKIVLERMQKLNMISQDEMIEAAKQKLPLKPGQQMSEPAPYVVREINRQLADLPKDQGLRVLTGIDNHAQAIAQHLLRNEMDHLENTRADLKILRSKGHLLEAALVSIDLHSGHILSLVGGRDYRKTQLNRIFESRRQVGSTMKPFVYLTALESTLNFNPLTTVVDEPLTHKYEGQTWSPRNYDKIFRGKLPAYYALKESLNVPTAKIGIEAGLKNIVEVAKRAGITSTLEPLPSLTLGAFELRPIELATSYMTLARLGNHIEPALVIKAENLNGQTLFEYTQTPEQVFTAENSALLLGMMKNTFVSGTAKAARLMGFEGLAAGKTGTTSDLKDSWFVGMTPNILTLVWVGYDQNLTTGMTGASSALPLWVKYMKSADYGNGDEDFAWPTTVTTRHLTSEDLQKYFDVLPESESPGVNLIMRANDSPFDN